MKFQIIMIKRKTFAFMRFLPLKVLVRFENGDVHWFDTYNYKSGLFWYRLNEHILDFLKMGNSSRKIFAATFEITNEYSYQKWEDSMKDVRDL